MLNDHDSHMAKVAIQQVASYYGSPSVLYRPKVYKDGEAIVSINYQQVFLIRRSA